MLVGALVGGASGSLVRAAVIEVLDRPVLALLMVNVVGSFVAGFAVVQLDGRHPIWAIAVVTGFCGGLTSLSTWAVQVVELVDGGDAVLGLGVTALTAVGALVGAAAGWKTAR